MNCNDDGYSFEISEQSELEQLLIQFNFSTLENHLISSFAERW